MANKFKKGDQVLVNSGSDKGKIGKIILVKNNKAVVEGVNIRTIHKKPTSNEPGKIIKSEGQIDLSNLSHVEDGKPVKIKFINEINENGSKIKVRVSKKSGKKIV